MTLGFRSRISPLRVPFAHRFLESRYLSKITSNPPRHVAIIMDGNGRWAKKRGLPRLKGHQQGTKATKRIVIAAIQARVKFLTIYVFSSENWKRPVGEVNNLMDLFVTALVDELDELDGNGVNIRIIGDRTTLPEKIITNFDAAYDRTKKNTSLYLNLALNYGGRQEILSAVNTIVSQSVKDGDAVEEDLEKYLYTAGMPDPDLVIRTGGDLRISNYLLWQSAYSEFYFTDTLWPDFTKAEFFKAIMDLGVRERRFGGIKNGADLND